MVIAMMEETINQLIGEAEFKEGKYSTDEDKSWFLNIPSIGTISVVNRMTGFLGYGRDTETGFTDTDGAFWLVSYQHFDIREYADISIVKAIQLIKKRSNVCRKAYPY